MPRAKKAVMGQQVYSLPGYGPHAKVTVDYDVEHAPPFFQPAPGVVIVGEHACAPQPMVLHDATAYGQPEFGGRGGYEVPRGGNFDIPEDDPAYQAFKASGGRGLAPAPPGISPKVLTSEENFGMKPGSGELTALLDGAAPVGETEEN
jgi:hypothetical protein